MRPRSGRKAIEQYIGQLFFAYLWKAPEASKFSAETYCRGYFLAIPENVGKPIFPVLVAYFLFLAHFGAVVGSGTSQGDWQNLATGPFDGVVSISYGIYMKFR